jgi:dTDP-4-amino-4,6-dideoxygalactose transaminase
VKVPYLDLRVNDESLKKELICRIEKILSHGRIVGGPEQEEFEEKFASEIGVKYVVGVGSGSSALYLALLGLGVGPGDEVITTPFTWIITVNSIVATGAKPIFVDVQDDFNINPIAIEMAITGKTKAIVPMHVAGHICDMTSISRIAKDNNLLIIEDAAQAFCSSLNGKRAGAFSQSAAFSMNPMKILHAYGEAGAVTTNNKKVYNKIKQMRHAGTKRDKAGKHINRCHYIALNHKIDTIQASMLISSMDRINEIKAKRDQIASLYDEAFSDIMGIQKVRKGEIHGRYIYIMACKRRDGLRKYLLNNGIENKVFYSPLACDATVYKDKINKINIPVARRLLSQSLSVPLHEKMTIKQAEYVISTIHRFYN